MQYDIAENMSVFGIELATLQKHKRAHNSRGLHRMKGVIGDNLHNKKLQCLYFYEYSLVRLTFLTDQLFYLFQVSKVYLCTLDNVLTDILIGKGHKQPFL